MHLYYSTSIYIGMYGYQISRGKWLTRNFSAFVQWRPRCVHGLSEHSIHISLWRTGPAWLVPFKNMALGFVWEMLWDFSIFIFLALFYVLWLHWLFFWCICARLLPSLLATVAVNSCDFTAWPSLTREIIPRNNGWLVVWNIWIISIYWESSSQLTNIFQRGGNHQPVMVSTARMIQHNLPRSI